MPVVEVGEPPNLRGLLFFSIEQGGVCETRYLARSKDRVITWVDSRPVRSNHHRRR
jgi:hypothetical protein